MSADDLREIVEKKPESLGARIRSKALQAVLAIAAGVQRVHLVDGRIYDGLINEIFSNIGVGSLIYGNDYQQVRKATRRDVRGIYNLTRHAVKREELAYRTQQAIEKNIDHFFVYEIDENLIATVSLTPYAEAPTVGEVGSLYVQPFYHGRGVGTKMVSFACKEAQRRGMTRVLALSTQGFAFFTGVLGFEEGTREDLPESRRKGYDDSGRNSRILVRKVS
jgi:amino-acid N-acetyltransferase